MTSISDTEVVNAPGGLVELGYAQVSSTYIITSTSSTNTTAFIGPVTVVSDGSPLLIEFQSPASSVGSGQIFYVNLVIDGAVTGIIAQSYDSNGQQNFPVRASRRVTLSAGSHTIALAAWAGSSGPTIQAGAGGAGSFHEMELRVSKIIQASQLLVTQSNAPTVTDLPSNPVINQEVHHLVNNSYFDKKYNGSTWVNINEQPSVEVVAGAAQTGFVVDTWTKLTFPSATVTNNFGFTISNGVITIPSSLGGLYHVSGQCQWDANNSGIRLLTFAESGNYNGTVFSGPTVSSAAYMRTPVSGLIRLTGGQSYCLWGINSGSGGTRDLTITFLTQRFNIVRVSS